VVIRKSWNSRADVSLFDSMIDGYRLACLSPGHPVESFVNDVRHKAEQASEPLLKASAERIGESLL
jgi:hypothetical protein